MRALQRQDHLFSRHVVFEGEPLGQLPYAGAEKHVVELLERGRISVFLTVELPDRSLYEAYEFGQIVYSSPRSLLRSWSGPFRKAVMLVMASDLCSS